MVQLLNHIHLFAHNEEYAFFDKETFSLTSLNKPTYQVIEMLQKGIGVKEVSLNLNIPLEDIKSLIARLSRKVNEGSLTEEKKEKPVIRRITLHISNDCNLRCKYCYASGGNYKMKRGLMTEETANSFIDFCVQNFGKVENIVFFGGEPFMNSSIIKYVCEKFTRLKNEGVIDYCPNFGAITNGTIMTEEVKTMVEKYFSFITVSIDGPQAINDFNRVDRYGKGSYERIKDFIERIKEMSNMLLRYEATFTKQHLLKGYTHQSLQEFFKVEFGIEGDVVNEQSMEKENMYSNTVVETKDDKTSYDSTFWSVLTAVVEKQSKTMCPLYRGMLAVSVDGELYPCHMNAGDKGCSLGNVKGENIYNNKDSFVKKQPGLKTNFKDNSVCNKCWSNKICGGCSRLWFYDEDEHVYNTYPKERLCQANNRYLEQILFQIIHLRKNPQKWDRFVSELKIA